MVDAAGKVPNCFLANFLPKDKTLLVDMPSGQLTRRKLGGSSKANIAIAGNSFELGGAAWLPCGGLDLGNVALWPHSDLCATVGGWRTSKTCLDLRASNLRVPC